MRAIDTNVLIRVIVGDDDSQTAAAENFVRRGAWISILVLAEAIWVLDRAYHLKPAALATSVEMLLGNPNVVLQDSKAVANALTLYRARPSLRFSDCLILEVARSAGYVPLGTFDRRLANADGACKI